MALTVIVRSGAGDPPLSISLDTPRLVIGRSEACEVRLPDPSISQRHASIRQRGADYLIVDEGSLNGTFVGPVRLSPQAPRILRSGDLVRIGKIWLEVQISATPLVATNHAATKELALNLVAHSLEADGEDITPLVRVTRGPDAGKSLALSEYGRPYVVGRSKSCALVVEDSDASRRHLEFTRAAGGIEVRDLGAKNGTLIGHKRLESGESLALAAGIEVVAGGNTLVCADPVSDALEELDRAADERLAADESIPPPSRSGGSATSGGSSADESAVPESHASNTSPPKLRPQHRLPPSSRQGWTSTDFLVLLLALSVIGFSLFGLSLLLGAD